MKELEPIEILDDLNLFLSILPSKIKKNIDVREYELIEVVMDLGRPPIIIYSSHQNIIKDEIVNLLDINSEISQNAL